MNILDNIKLTYNYIGFNTRKSMPAMNDYKVTLKYNNKQLTINYSMGKALSEKDLTVKSVIYSLLLDSDSASYDFNEFCANYGYYEKPITALNVYKQCKKIAVKFNNMFSKNEIQELQNLLQDY